MSQSERFKQAKESFTEKGPAKKFNNEISTDFKPVKTLNKKPISSENKPPIASQKPVFKRFESQNKLNDESKSLGVEENQRQKQHQQPTQDASSPSTTTNTTTTPSSVEVNVKPSALKQKTLKIEPAEKSNQRLPVRTPSTAANASSKSSELSKTPKVEAPQEKESTRCRTSQEFASGSSMILERIQKLKSVQEPKPSQTKKQPDTAEAPKATRAKDEIVQTPPRPVADAPEEKLYQLLTLAGVTGRAPRKPARPPSVNLDFLNLKGMTPVQRRQKDGKETSGSQSRPISILTEEQEMEEALERPLGADAGSHNSAGIEECEEIYEELD